MDHDLVKTARDIGICLGDQLTKIKNYGNIEEYQMSESLYTKESKKNGKV